MAQPRIKRYALMPDGANGRTRRFHLARVAPAPRSALGVDRLERMEEVAALEHSRPSPRRNVLVEDETSRASAPARA